MKKEVALCKADSKAKKMKYPALSPRKNSRKEGWMRIAGAQFDRGTAQMTSPRQRDFTRSTRPRAGEYRGQNETLC
jgi:hypothetical protein